MKVTFGNNNKWNLREQTYLDILRQGNLSYACKRTMDQGNHLVSTENHRLHHLHIILLLKKSMVKLEEVKMTTEIRIDKV